MKTSFLLFIALSIALISFSCSYDNPVSKDSGSGLTTDNSQTPSFRISLQIDQITPDRTYQPVNVSVDLTSLNWWGSNVTFYTENGEDSYFNLYYTFDWNNCPEIPVCAVFEIKDANGNLIHPKDVAKTYGVSSGTGQKVETYQTFLQEHGIYQYQLGLVLSDEDGKTKK
jgi:hypothetical protein